MIGNDVIDLELAASESNWKRKGWLEKVFTPSERQLIADAPDPNIMVWILWSMKESAYKINHRKTKIRAYIPQQLVCSALDFDGNNIDGKVRLGNSVFYTKTKVSTEFVHTIATSEIKTIDNLDVCFSDDYSKKNIPENIIKDNSGIPFFYNKSTKKNEIVSISHHGKFCSYLSVKLL